MKRLSIYLIITCLCFVAGCTSRHGSRIDESYVLNEIIKGKTTQTEIQNKFGPPRTTSINSDGQVGWIYPDVEMVHWPFGGNYKNKILRIQFVNGVVSNYNFIKDDIRF